MCELFALSAFHPTTVTLSLDAFARRGGDTGPHADGWGIAYFEGPDAVVIRDTAPAAKSPWVDFIAQTGLTSSTVISHIRKATQGDVRLANTQPFRRECGGTVHVFAHNGDLDALPDVGDAFLPIGDTDSEQAFCLLMERMRAVWRGDTAPPLVDRTRVFTEFCADMRPRGIANFLYSDGDYLFVHGHKRTQADGVKRPPGLHVLCRACAVDEGALKTDGLTIADGGQTVTLFASVPLTDEDWRPLDEGEIVVVAEGNLCR